MLAIPRNGYYVEPTPATVPEHEAHKDAPPLPPLPESVMALVAHGPTPRFPWRFLLSLVISFPLLWLLLVMSAGR